MYKLYLKESCFSIIYEYLQVQILSQGLSSKYLVRQFCRILLHSLHYSLNLEFHSDGMKLQNVPKHLSGWSENIFSDKGLKSISSDMGLTNIFLDFVLKKYLIELCPEKK